jgi:hypothetical protein
MPGVGAICWLIPIPKFLTGSHILLNRTHGPNPQHCLEDTKKQC